MDCKIEVIEAKLDGHKENFERHINDYRTLRATFTNVTGVIVGLIFGVSAAYVSGVYSLSKSQGSLEAQQVQLTEQQSAFASHQNETNKEMKEIKDQLIKINQSFDAILKDHEEARRRSLSDS